MYENFVGGADHRSALLFSSREYGSQGQRIDLSGVGSCDSPELIYFLVRKSIRYFRVKRFFLGLG
jgi:hypothetical protein